MTDEARIEDTPAGRVPADDGWFILNVADIARESLPGTGTCARSRRPTPVRRRSFAARGYAGRPPFTPARSPWPFPPARRSPG
jgi:hypothetical protein